MELTRKQGHRPELIYESSYHLQEYSGEERRRMCTKYKGPEHSCKSGRKKAYEFALGMRHYIELRVERWDSFLYIWSVALKEEGGFVMRKKRILQHCYQTALRGVWTKVANFAG